MALAHAILVSLLDRPHSGYDLAKRFDQTVGYFWKASHQQIYLELHKLAESGLISAERVVQDVRPNRIVYQLTALGEDALHSWIEEPTEPPSYKEELLVKLFALGTADPAVLLNEIGKRLHFHEQRLAHYQQVMQAHYPVPEKLSARKRGHYLGLRLGVLFEESVVRWCQEATSMVSPLASAAVKSAKPRSAKPAIRKTGTRRKTL
ncbi:DNA-binding transcriptional regulator, PadR family [Solimonas aquatica]|uniref:DNA-binding transcriptional regulator, PadR family n=1 Tax=Solimonas aquatica TaxID=489703 RepID=A0A1H9IQ07_9GAMM|nr:PadR family transcriptional regulator [Solimonas aquatica]SEQ76660.1 DNA-binding transcriptional regulator, PadR family [Solimonas aquatica]